MGSMLSLAFSRTTGCQEPLGLFSHYNVHGSLNTSPKGLRVRAEQLPCLFEKPMATEPLVRLTFNVSYFFILELWPAEPQLCICTEQAHSKK